MGPTRRQCWSRRPVPRAPNLARVRSSCREVAAGDPDAGPPYMQAAPAGAAAGQGRRGHGRRLCGRRRRKGAISGHGAGAVYPNPSGILPGAGPGAYRGPMQGTASLTAGRRAYCMRCGNTCRAAAGSPPASAMRRRYGKTRVDVPRVRPGSREPRRGQGPRPGARLGGGGDRVHAGRDGRLKPITRRPARHVPHGKRGQPASPKCGFSGSQPAGSADTGRSEGSDTAPPAGCARTLGGAAAREIRPPGSQRAPSCAPAHVPHVRRTPRNSYPSQHRGGSGTILHVARVCLPRQHGRA